MSLPPIDHLGGTAHGMPRAAAPQGDPRDHPLPPYDPRPASMGIAGWSIVLGVLALLVAAVALAHRDLRHIAARDAAVANARQCAIPHHDGDAVVLTVRNRGGQLVATCRRVTDWKTPERFAE